MKLFVAGDNGSQFPAFVLEAPNISGVTVRLPYSNFAGAGGGYNQSFMRQLINDFKLIKSYSKEIAVAVEFGKFFDAIPGIRFVILHDAHHQNKIQGTTIVPTKQPVFWDTNYINHVNDFFYWFSNQLKNSEVYDAITQIKITGVNEKTEELKASDQDWRTPQDTSEIAYRQAAEVWLSTGNGGKQGYNVSKVKMTIAHFIDLFAELFPDKIIVLPVIGSLSGFPAININGICLARDREDISKELIEYGVDMYPEIFGCQSSALMIEGGVPKKVSQSSAAEIVYQVERLLYNPDPPFPKTKLEQDAFQMVLENGRKNGATIIEVFQNTLRSFPNMHG